MYISKVGIISLPTAALFSSRPAKGCPEVVLELDRQDYHFTIAIITIITIIIIIITIIIIVLIIPILTDTTTTTTTTTTNTTTNSNNNSDNNNSSNNITARTSWARASRPGGRARRQC